MLYMPHHCLQVRIMKLKPEFIAQNIEDTQFLVSVAQDGFSGIIRSNPTAAFIVDMLKEPVTQEEIVEAMCSKYDADREMIAGDVARVLGILRRIGALEE